MAPMRGREPMVCTPEQAVEAVSSGHRVFVQGIAATPTLLTSALAERGKEVNNADIAVLSHVFVFVCV